MTVFRFASAALSVLVLYACGGADGAAGPERARPVARMVITSGDAQRGPAGATLPTILTVKAVDAASTPVAGAIVSFVVTRGGGSVLAGTDTTDADGIAQERWTLGRTAADTQRVEVRAVDRATGQTAVFATFSATTTAAAPARITAVEGDGQTAPAGTTVPVAPRVRVFDQFDNAVSGAPVTFVVADGGGTVTRASATTDSSGYATAGSWTLGPAAGIANGLRAMVVDAALTTFTAISTSPVRVTIATPAATTTVSGDIAVAVSATTLAASGSIATVSATVDGRTTALAAAGASWSGVIPMTGAVAGAKVLTVVAEDRAHNQATTTTGFTYTPPLPRLPSPDLPPSVSYVQFQSEADAWVGQGQSFLYTKAVADIGITPNGGRATIIVAGDWVWIATFQSPSGFSRLQPGVYVGLGQWTFSPAAKGALDVSGGGSGCSGLAGAFQVDSVTYAGDAITKLDLHFEQRCVGDTGTLRGTIHWRADDVTAAPGPVVPPPASLWAPPAGSTPSSGNYLYLASEAGDNLGQGQTFTIASPTVATVGLNARSVSVSAGAWSGRFSPMNSIDRLQPGYYGNVDRYLVGNPTRGGLDWSFQSSGCNSVSGWFVVDRVEYVAGALTALDVRFEQHCERAAPALHGAVHWTAH